MKRWTNLSWWTLVLTLTALMALPGGPRTTAAPARQAERPITDPTTGTYQAAGTAKLPLTFVPNVGQINATARFQAQVPGGTLFFTPAEVGFVPAVGKAKISDAELESSRGTKSYSAVGSLDSATLPSPVIRLQWLDANPAPTLAGDNPLPGRVNYFLGNDPAQWRTNVPTYQGITYRELYPGVDLDYTGVNGHLKGTYRVAPGADTTNIRWRYEGATDVVLDAAGNLVIHLAGGAGVTMTEQAPVAWQEIQGQRRTVAVHYMLMKDRSISFAVGSYDRTQPLIIDPTLIYSTYLGGSGGDAGFGIAVDKSGNTYITGYTTSTDFPTASPYQPNNGGGSEDVFVAKLNGSGSELVYATYLGGSSFERGLGIAVDEIGNAYVTGNTDSPNWPLVKPFQPNRGGNGDAFVAKLDASGATLAYSTYLGGRLGDSGNAIAVNQEGNAFITGVTLSSDFPTANPLQPNRNGGNRDAFVAQLNTNGSRLIYATYIGGTGRDNAQAIAIDPVGRVYVGGETDSQDFPLVQPLQANNRGATDGFIAKLSPLGASLIYSTYLGGEKLDSIWDIAIDRDGNAYLTGETASSTFPIINPIQAGYVGPEHDAFITKLDVRGTELIYSTYLGGSSADVGLSIAVDVADNVYVTGITYSSDFPLAHPLQPQLGGDVDGFLVKLNASGSDLDYSTYLGGKQLDWCIAIAVDSMGAVYVTGVTSSSDFPVSDPYQLSNRGQQEVIILKVADSLPPVSTPVVVPTVPIPGNGSRTFPETGQTVQGLFLAYWDGHGGLPQQGYPISGVLGEVSDLDGKPYTVQYFERAVFEYHLEYVGTPYEVLLAQLGTYRYLAKYGGAGASGQHASTKNPLYFPETGKTLGEPFRTYWEQHGGLAQQGYPISDEFIEASELDAGKYYTVQYFERSVFEHHPENAGTPYEVLLAQLGTYRYSMKYDNK